VKYRVPSVPLALSSLRDRAAPVDSSYSRISPRFCYDGVSRDLCKMVRSSLGSLSARSTLYLTRARPWRVEGPLAATPRFLSRGFALARKVDRGGRNPSHTRAHSARIPAERASERAAAADPDVSEFCHPWAEFLQRRRSPDYPRFDCESNV